MQPQCITPAELTPEQRSALLADVHAPGKPRPVIDSDLAINYARISRSVQKSINDQWFLNDKNTRRLSSDLGRTITVAVRLKDEQSGLDANRNGYRELLRLADTRQHGHILLYMADRLSRDDIEFLFTVRKLLRMGMRLWDYSLGEITVHNVGDLAAQAYKEVRKTATRTQDMMEAKAAQGVKFGPPLLGYVHKPAPGKDAQGVEHKYALTADGKPDQYDLCRCGDGPLGGRSSERPLLRPAPEGAWQSHGG
jgi:DNA invertase Pin-like site-specific DNA recombinase